MTIYKIEYNTIIDVLGNNLYYFGICSKIPELLTTLMQLAHKGEELIAVNRRFNVKIETVLELAFGDLAALEFHKVHATCVEARHYAEESSGAVRYVNHHTCAVGT